jgi:hypothetical protein
MFFARLYLVSFLTGLSISNFLKKVLIPVSVVVILSVFSIYHLDKFFTNSILDFIIFGLLCCIVNFIIIYIFGIDKDLKIKIISFIKRKVGKKI